MMSIAVTANTDDAPEKLVLKETLTFSLYINLPELYRVNIHFIDYFIIQSPIFHNVGDGKQFFLIS